MMRPLISPFVRTVVRFTLDVLAGAFVVYILGIIIFFVLAWLR